MKFLIWSYEHKAWWLPGSSGYTESIEDAGVYMAQYLDDTVDGYPSSLPIPHGKTVRSTDIPSLGSTPELRTIQTKGRTMICPICNTDTGEWIDEDTGQVACDMCGQHWNVGKGDWHLNEGGHYRLNVNAGRGQAHARNTDPESSHIAADKMEEGGRQSHEARILTAIQGFVTCYKFAPTARKLAGFFEECKHGGGLTPLTAVQINRRVKGMMEQGLLHTRPGSAEGKEQLMILGPDPTPLKTLPFNSSVPAETRAHLIVEDILILNDTSDKDLIDAIVEYAIDLGITKKTRSTANTRYDITWMEMVLTKLKAALLERMPGHCDGRDIVGREGNPCL